MESMIIKGSSALVQQLIQDDRGCEIITDLFRSGNLDEFQCDHVCEGAHFKAAHVTVDGHSSFDEMLEAAQLERARFPGGFPYVQTGEVTKKTLWIADFVNADPIYAFKAIAVFGGWRFRFVSPLELMAFAASGVVDPKVDTYVTLLSNNMGRHGQKAFVELVTKRGSCSYIRGCLPSQDAMVGPGIRFLVTCV